MATGRERLQQNQALLQQVQEQQVQLGGSQLRGQQAQQGAPDEGGIFTGKGRRERREAAEAASLAEQQEAQQTINVAQGQQLFDQLGFSGEQLDDPRVQAVQSGLAQPGIRPQTLIQAEDLQREFGLNRPLSETIAEGFRQDEVNRQMDVAVANEERQLRNTYYKRIAPMIEGQQALQLALGQMELGSGPSAFNTARLFVRQLDQSMFASDEFAAQVQQFGAQSQIANFFSWVAGGGAFDKFSRAEMVQSMTVIAEVYNATSQQLRAETMELASRSRLPLTPENTVALDNFANRGFREVISEAGQRTGAIIEQGRTPEEQQTFTDAQAAAAGFVPE